MTDDRDLDQRALDELSQVFGGDARHASAPDGDVELDATSPTPAPTAPTAAPDRAASSDPDGRVDEIDEQPRRVTNAERIAQYDDAPPTTEQAEVARPTIRIGWSDDAATVDEPQNAPIDPGLMTSTSEPSGGGGAPGGDAAAVIEIDDSELPDAVYVQGSLSADSSSPVVFIEADDTDRSDAVDADAARADQRGIEPRLRDRRQAVQRAVRRRRLLIAGGAITGFAVVVAFLALVGSSLFSVSADKIAVSGARFTSRDDLQEVVDDLLDAPILRVDVAAVERDLEALPWVDRAEVDVAFPDSASIDIVERAPLTTYRGSDGRYRVLDREGRVLDVIEGFPIEFVWITTNERIDLDEGEFAPAGIAAASELVQNLTPTVRSRIERIDTTADGSSLTALLSDGIEVNFGAANELFEKLVRLETLLNRYPDLVDSRLDVSTPETTRASLPSAASPPGGDDE